MMGIPEGFSGGDFGTEVRRDPEVTELLEFLSIYKEIQEIISWLIEASANSSFTSRAIRRARLRTLIQKLGLDPESPDAFTQLENLKAGLSDRTLHPKPRIEVPGAGFFKSRIKELIREQGRYGNPTPFDDAVNGNADLVDLAQYGHSDWTAVHTRTDSKDTSEWTRDIAIIMADPIAYQAIFAGLSIDAGRKTAADHLYIASDWAIQNGRHRSLALRCLGGEYVLEAGMAQWVPVTVEKS